MTPEILLTCTPRFNWNHPSIVHDDSFNLQRWVSLALTLLCSDMDRCPATFQGVFNQLWVFFGLHLFFGNGGEVLLIFLSSVRKEKIYVNSTSVNRSTPLSVPTDQRYWLHNALFTWLPPPPLLPLSDGVHTKPVTLAVRCEKEKSTMQLWGEQWQWLPWWLFVLGLMASRLLNPAFKRL